MNEITKLKKRIEGLEKENEKIQEEKNKILEEQEELGWLLLAEESLKDIWENEKDDRVWKKYLEKDLTKIIKKINLL